VANYLGLHYSTASRLVNKGFRHGVSSFCQFD
jgi:hypothetical protein